MSIKSISDFKSAFKDGGARANLFRVRLFFPTAVSAGPTASAAAEFFCKGTATPASTVNQIPIPFMGRELKIPGDRTFEDWTVTVMAGEDMVIRNAFEEWSELVNSNESNTAGASLDDLFQDAEVEMLSKNGDIIKKYKVEDIWPSEVAGFELDFSSADTILEFGVTFAIHNWKSDTTS